MQDFRPNDNIFPAWRVPGMDLETHFRTGQKTPEEQTDTISHIYKERRFGKGMNAEDLKS